MATILAIDTSTSACSVALAIDSAVQEDFEVVPQSHTQKVLPMVDRLLADHQLSLAAVDAIALTTGPGSFTGLRIGLGLVQGLAFGADVPVISESSLRVLSSSASRLLTQANHKWVVPCLDARMQEVNWACYCDGNAVIEDRIAAPGGMLETLQTLKQPLFGVGDGWSCVDAPTVIETKAVFYPHAYDLAILAQEAFQSGRLQAAIDVQPTYLRNEVSWKKRQKIRDK